MVVPILAILPLSFNGSQFLGLSGAWNEHAIVCGTHLLPKVVQAIWNSLLIGSAAAIVATVQGTIAASGAFLTAFLLSPMVVPVVVFGVGLSLFLGPLGPVRSYSSIILGACRLGQSVRSDHGRHSAGSYDRNLTRAARGLGAGPLYAFRRVMLPLITPGVLSGVVFAFATSFDEVVVVMPIGGPEHRTLPREMLSASRESLSPTIALAATVMTLFAIALITCVQLLRRAHK